MKHKVATLIFSSVFKFIFVFAILFNVHLQSFAKNTPVPSDVFEVTSADVVTEYDGVIATQSFFLGLAIKLKQPWHTYWINPGDSGAPIKIEVSSQTELEVRSELYPPPLRIDTGRIVTYGYENNALIAAEIKVKDTSAKNLKVGDKINFKISAEWLVCADVCIPAIKDWDVNLEVKDLSTINKTEFATAFDTLRLNQPMPLNALLAIDPTSESAAGGKIILKTKEANLIKRFKQNIGHDFFPFKESKLTNDKPEGITFNDDELTIVTRKSKNSTVDQVVNPTGLIKINNGKESLFLQSGQSPVSVFNVIASASSSDTTIFGVLAFAFFAALGGLLLNLMPCVFPILSLKVFKLLKSNDKERKALQVENIFYALGCVVSFVSLGIIILLLQKTGSALGWGFQLQSLWFVLFLAVLFFVMALNFIGLFEFPNIPLPGFKKSANAHLESFFSGVLAVIVASPCTAPFMGASLGYALGRSPLEVIIIFSSLGLGLASPYLALSYSPKLLSLLPKPGGWMIRLKQFMALPMLLTVAWLAWLGYQIHTFDKSSQKLENSQEGWMPFSNDKLNEALSKNERVFINFTADWCITCKVNELNVFSDETVKQFFKDNSITLMKGDWTKRNPEISAFLKSYNRAGVPMYVYFAQGSKTGVLLPELLTESVMIEQIAALNKK